MMVVELKDYSMTENNSQPHRPARTPEIQRSKLRSSFKMIRKLFKSKKQNSASTGNLSCSDIGDDESIPDHASSTGSPPPPYRSNSFDKSVTSIGSGSSGGDMQEQRDYPSVENPENRSHPSRILTVTIKRDSDTLLGIVISVSTDKHGAYPVVRRVLPDSQASKSGALYSGDEILKVNKTDVRGMTHRQVTSLFKSNGRQLVLSIRRKVGDLFLAPPSDGRSSVRRSASFSGSVLSEDKISLAEDKSQIIEIFREDRNEDTVESPCQMSSFHPTSPTARLAPKPTSPTRVIKIPLPGMEEKKEIKNENTVVDRFSRRSCSAAAAVYSMKSPRHTLLVPGSADMNLFSIENVLTPQSAPASPAESRKYDSDIADELAERKRDLDFSDTNDITEAWSTEPFVRSQSMRQPKKGGWSGTGWNERSYSVSNGRKSSHRRLRDSFRLGKKSSKQTDSEPAGSVASQKCDTNKTMPVNLKVPSLQELGLRLAGGSVSPYGTCNLTVQSVSGYGTAKEVLKPGDLIIAIDGMNSEQMTAFEAYRLLQNYLGKTVEVVISRTLRQ